MTGVREGLGCGVTIGYVVIAEEASDSVSSAVLASSSTSTSSSSSNTSNSRSHSQASTFNATGRLAS